MSVFLLARVDPNAVSLRSTPIIVVPGIMGTRLRLEDADWDPDDSEYMARKWLRWSTLEMRKALHHASPGAVNHEGTSHSPDEHARGWASLVVSCYGEFLRALHDEYAEFAPGIACPVYAFGYDWRQNNVESARALAEFTRSVLEDEDAESVVFVTHSMGGYVTRRMLLDDKALGNKTLTVIHIAQPVRGAPVAYRRLIYGTAREYDGLVMRFLLGREPEDTLRLFSAMPSAIQLLPSDTRRTKLTRSFSDWMWGHRRNERDPFPIPPVESSVYGLYTYGSHPPNVAKELHKGHLRLGDTEEEKDAFQSSRKDVKSAIGAAKDFHKGLALKHHSATYTITGTGVVTDERVVFYYQSEDFEGVRDLIIEAAEVERGRGSDGDGTVPAWSATALLADPVRPVKEGVDPELFRQYSVVGLEHDKICLRDDVYLLIQGILSEILEAPEAVLGGGQWRNRPAIIARYLVAKFSDSEINRKGAEMELRVAKLYRELGGEVFFMDNPSDSKSPDLDVDGVTVEVKWSRDGKPEVIRSLILDGFAKADRTVLVRGTGSKIPRATFDDVGAQALADRPGNKLDIFEEDELPPLGGL